MDQCNFTVRFTLGLNSRSTVVLCRVCNATCYSQAGSGKGWMPPRNFKPQVSMGSQQHSSMGKQCPRGPAASPARAEIVLIWWM